MSCLVGCQVDSVSSGTVGGSRMPPKPRQAPDVPIATPVTRMVFMVGTKPQDTNGNGFPDRVQCTVGLFPERYDSAVHREGRFTLTMYPMGMAGQPDIEPLGVWTREGDELIDARTRAVYGDIYQFSFSLLEVGSDEYPLTRADLVCRFESTDGNSDVHSQGIRSILIGRR